MNTRHCCQTATRDRDNVRRPASRLRRGGEIAGWIVPSVTLALLPKCPVCVAAYVAFATGIGISLPTATYLRAMLAVLCVASLVLITARRLRSLFARGVSLAVYWGLHLYFLQSIGALIAFGACYLHLRFRGLPKDSPDNKISN